VSGLPDPLGRAGHTRAAQRFAAAIGKVT
jgi:hypothetical protein